MTVRTKRIYDPPAPEDGYRVLVDRLWPRGLSREKAAIDRWAKEVAPSDGLRRWVHADPARWPEFELRYRAEISIPEASAALAELAARARTGTVTLLHAKREEGQSHASVLADVLRDRASS